DPLAHPRGVDAGIDNQMRDVDAFWAELARRTLRYGAQAKFGAGKGGITDPTANSSGGAGKENIAAAARRHQPRRRPPSQRGGAARWGGVDWGRGWEGALGRFP